MRFFSIRLILFKTYLKISNSCSCKSDHIYKRGCSCKSDYIYKEYGPHHSPGSHNTSIRSLSVQGAFAQVTWVLHTEFFMQGWCNEFLYRHLSVCMRYNLRPVLMTHLHLFRTKKVCIFLKRYSVNILLHFKAKFYRMQTANMV